MRSNTAALRGLALPRPALRRLADVGIFARSEVSLEHQHLAKQYVIRGVESGGAVREIGRYVTFAGEVGDPLGWLQPIDALGPNGVHAVVIAPSLVRVEMFRHGRTYELLITRHSLGNVADGRRPPLASTELFRGVNGYLALELWGKDRDLAGSVMPAFYSRSGEPIEIPVAFHRATRAITAAVNCVPCSHCHYVRHTGAAAAPDDPPAL
jgi:hypothetical protein